MSEIVKVTDLSDEIEILAAQTVSYQFTITVGQRLVFTITDATQKSSGFGLTPDLSLIVWFSREPKFENYRYANSYLNYLPVQQKAPLIVACSHNTYVETEPTLKDQSAVVPSGKHYINVQNKHGAPKVFKITIA